MKKTLILALTLFGALLMTAEKTAAQTIEPDGTYMFVQRDTCELFMDVYNPKRGSQTSFQGKQKPAIIFMFGGGFIGGTRDNKDYHNWFSPSDRDGSLSKLPCNHWRSSG